jgi:hypothetical protein
MFQETSQTHLLNNPMPAKLAAGLVRAQAHIGHIANDQYADDYRTGHATPERVNNATSEALAAGNLALVLAGWTLHNSADGRSMARVPCLLIHESGEAMPTFMCEAAIPEGEQCPDVQSLRRVLLAQILNTGWDTQNEALWQILPDGHEGEGAQDTTPEDSCEDLDTLEANTPTEPTEPAEEPNEAAQTAVTFELIGAARMAIAGLMGQFKYASAGEVYGIATGKDPTWPDSAVDVDFLAAIQLAAMCMEAKVRDLPPPRSHAEFIALADNFDVPDLQPLFVAGTLSAHGEKILGETVRSFARAGKSAATKTPN